MKVFLYVFADSRYHLNFAKVENGALLPRTKYLHHTCNKTNERNTYCTQSGVLDAMCRFSKFHISKTVRLGLDVASKFLEDPNVKIIYVARDPRGNNTLFYYYVVYNLECSPYMNGPSKLHA